jgi:hypothetical protein
LSYLTAVPSAEQVTFDEMMMISDLC